MISFNDAFAWRYSMRPSHPDTSDARRRIVVSSSNDHIHELTMVSDRRRCGLSSAQARAIGQPSLRYVVEV
jgi:hypothetical protein